jgi:hypothetical protein
VTEDVTPADPRRGGAGVVAGLAVAMIVAVVVAALVVGGDDDPGPVVEQVPFGMDDDGRGPDPTGALVAAPLVLDPATANLALDFATDADALPMVDDLGSWSVGRGTWAVRAGQARAELDAGFALAWLPTPAALEAQVVAPDPGATVGLAVRIVDADSYLAWVREASGTTVLLRIGPGVLEVMGRVEGAAAGREEEPLGVRVTAHRVEAFVAGTVEASVELPAEAGAAGIGLVVLGAEPGITSVPFDDLLVRFLP